MGDARCRTQDVHAHSARQCPFPHASLMAAPGTGLLADCWVQSYNNPTYQFAHGDVGTLRSACSIKVNDGLPSGAVYLGCQRGWVLPIVLRRRKHGCVAGAAARRVRPIMARSCYLEPLAQCEAAEQLAKPETKHG